LEIDFVLFFFFGGNQVNEIFVLAVLSFDYWVWCFGLGMLFGMSLGMAIFLVVFRV
jgi:hypothetical protein